MPCGSQRCAVLGACPEPPGVVAALWTAARIDREPALRCSVCRADTASRQSRCVRWPDFDAHALRTAAAEYGRRTRWFGGTPSPVDAVAGTGNSLKLR